MPRKNEKQSFIVSRENRGLSWEKSVQGEPSHTVGFLESRQAGADTPHASPCRRESSLPEKVDYSIQL